jgi:hypothetical protein
MSDPGGWLGDYEHLMAVGKDFYGIFSASNFPDNANFPQGVTYLRNANFSTHQLLGTNGTTVIGGSMDPFFFQVTEITDVNDFFVRDFTNSTTDFDQGLEPSTYPWFYVNSDVWNKRSDVPGIFNVNNQPQSEDPWQTTDGHNYAFARVHRKAAGATQNVSLHYLYAEFGTGSNFVNANTTADPTVSFGAADLEVTATNGYQWELPVTTSTHTCLAVEISTVSDPIIAPSLLNHAPGWNNGTDLMVLNDNNKAQRNMEVYRVPPGGGSVSSYAAIHNPGIYETNLKINWKTDLYPGIRIKPSVMVVNGREKSKISNNDVTLMNMKPGETRYLKISYPVSGNKEGEIFPLVFGEIQNGPVVNGFTVARQNDKIENVVLQNVKYDALVLRRISKLYNSSDAELIRKADLNFIDKNSMSGDDYMSLFEKNYPSFKAAVTYLLKDAPNDPFDLVAALTETETLLKNKKTTGLLTAHLSLLNAIDALVTSLQLQKGNTADFLQTVYIQKDVIELLKTKRAAINPDGLLAATNKFIDITENRKLSIKNYPEHVKDVLPDLKNIVEKMKNNNDLMKSLSMMERNLNDVTGLQKEHINFLLLLREAVKKIN